MALRVLDSGLELALIAERRASGADRYDEVWNGEYRMSPLANNEHQQLATKLAGIFERVLGDRDDVWCLAGANVSDQAVEWTKNFRCPDVVVVLPGSRAQNRDTHWLGGPDLVVEIVSEGDASYEKFEFYEKIGVREVLVIDRDPWSLSLHRLNTAGSLQLVQRVDATAPDTVSSDVLKAELGLILGGKRPKVYVVQHGTGVRWNT